MLIAEKIKKFFQEEPINRLITGPVISNSIYLIANTFISSLLGFFFWIVAARSCNTAEVGIGAAYLNAMNLIAMLGELGLGIAVVRYASSMEAKKGYLFLNSSLDIIGISTLILAVIFIVGVPILSKDLNELQSSALTSGIFLASTLCISLSLHIDRFYVAFQKTEYVLFRNVIAALIRLASVIFLGRVFGGIGLMLSAGIAALITSLLSLYVFAPRAIPGYQFNPEMDISLLKEKAGYTLNNYLSNLLWSAPPIIFPLLTISMLGPDANAHFYINWMLANFLYVVPISISTTAFAKASRDSKNEKPIWTGMLITILILIPLSLIFLLLVPHVLPVFGKDYSSGDQRLLFILGLAVFPYTATIFTLYLYRFRQNITNNFILPALVALMSIGAVFYLAPRWALTGVALSWLVAQTAGCFFMFGDLFKSRHELINRIV